MSTNILLTGASGFIGNAFVNKLINQNNKALNNFKIFYLRRPNRKVNIDGAEPIDLENNSQDSFNKALCNNNFDYVYNFASYGVKRSDNDITEYIDGNITFLAHLIRGFLQPPKLFVNIGSCAEYGFIKDGVKANEEDIIRPNSLYAASKASALDFGVNVAKDKLLETNPHCNIVVHSEHLTKGNINLLKGFDIIIDASDNWHTSKLINKFCLKNSIKYIFSSAVNYSIQICLFENNHKHVCLNCLFPNEDDAELARCDTIGISSVCAGIAGLITAQKTINAVLNTKDESNILTLINTLNLSITSINIKNNPNCLLNNS